MLERTNPSGPANEQSRTWRRLAILTFSVAAILYVVLGFVLYEAFAAIL